MKHAGWRSSRDLPSKHAGWRYPSFGFRSPRRESAPRLALPFELGFDGLAGSPAPPGVHAGGVEEEGEAEAGLPRHLQEAAAGENVEDGVHGAEHVLGLHEEIDEAGLVVLVDELEEGLEA